VTDAMLEKRRGLRVRMRSLGVILAVVVSAGCVSDNGTFRQLVRERAQFRCEYCRMPERLLRFHRFEADHIRPEKSSGCLPPPIRAYRWIEPACDPEFAPKDP
jgi:hypothetical protein